MLDDLAPNARPSTSGGLSRYGSGGGRHRRYGLVRAIPNAQCRQAAHAPPLSDPNIVWTTLLLGIWIPNLYYWGLNQYIIQRTLGAQSLAEGQKGIVFAAALKLIIPFIVVFPGIIAFNLFSDKMINEAENDKQANATTWGEFEELEPNAADAENRSSNSTANSTRSGRKRPFALHCSMQRWPVWTFQNKTRKHSAKP